MLTLPFIVVCTLVGFAATLLQTGFTLATEAIKLNFKALNPVAGMKRIFSMRTVKELVKSLCYLVVFAVTCHSLIQQDLRQALTLYRADMPGLVAVWVALAVKAVVVFIAWSIFVLLADLLVEYFLHFKDMKMDKHEVKQEHKESDGNPQIKARDAVRIRICFPVRRWRRFAIQKWCWRTRPTLPWRSILTLR
jgi:type III secretion protein U